MGKKAKVFLVVAIIATIVIGTWGAVRVVKYIDFNMNCTQHLKRAADANTVDRAKEELASAISYAEKNGLTKGVVSIIFHQPKNDVGYWYNNLCEARAELENLPEDTSSLEKTNVLMKLRETLTDETDKGTSVTIPNGITIYPNNIAYFWWSLIFGIVCVGFWLLFAVARYNYWD